MAALGWVSQMLRGERTRARSCLPSRHNLLLCARMEERKVKPGRDVPAASLDAPGFCCRLLPGSLKKEKRCAGVCGVRGCGGGEGVQGEGWVIRCVHTRAQPHTPPYHYSHTARRQEDRLLRTGESGKGGWRDEGEWEGDELCPPAVAP